MKYILELPLKELHLEGIPSWRFNGDETLAVLGNMKSLQVLNMRKSQYSKDSPYSPAAVDELKKQLPSLRKFSTDRVVESMKII